MEFTKPHIEYAELWPLFVVFGVACAGVLVEALVPRQRRFVAQVGLTVVGLLVALGGTIGVGLGLDTLKGGGARGLVAAEGALTVDGPSIYLWGLVLLCAIGGVLLFAERRLDLRRHRPPQAQAGR